MPTPVDPNQPNQGNQETQDANSYDENWMGQNYDYGNKAPSTSKNMGTQKSGYNPYSNPAYPNQGPQPNPGTKNMGGVSNTGDFPPGPGNTGKNSWIQYMLSQGYTHEQIKTMAQQEGYGPISDADIAYAQQGMMSGGPYGPGKYMSYGNSPYMKNYGNPYDLSNYFMQQQQYQDAQSMASDAKKSHHKQMIKISKILLLIMMGDVVGALRQYTAMMDRDFRKFSRDIINKLGLVRRARARVIRNFAQNKPPRAYAGSDPNSAARAQDMAQKYTQTVQLSTQLMSELQTSERNLVDYLQTMKRDLDNMWQAYASMRDNEFRTNERLMTVR